MKFRRLDMVQVRPHTGPVSRWSGGTQWVTIRFMMEYPLQPETANPFYKGHIGDSESIEVRLYTNDVAFKEWRVGEIVFPPHGGDLMYYGDIHVLARRADLLGTAYLWLAADQNSHGSWGGSETDSEECKGGGIASHDCFEGGSLQGALAGDYYWWFDATRDIGEPEALRYDAWPLEGRGPSSTIPQIKREGRHAAYIMNDTGFGPAREYISYGGDAPDTPTAKAYCGWRCPHRQTDGQCDPTDPGSVNNGYLFSKCDGGAVTFPSGSQFASIYPVGTAFYRPGYSGDFTYQLWGNPNVLPLLSGNVASAAVYGAAAAASSEYGSGAPASGAIDGDRKGTDWANGGGWSSARAPTAAAPEALRVDFAADAAIRRIDVFTLQDNLPVVIDPTPTTTFARYGITDFTVQYCPANVLCGAAAADDTGWVPVGTVANNEKVWTSFSFAQASARSVRVKVTGAAGGYARITEIEAWE